MNLYAAFLSLATPLLLLPLAHGAEPPGKIATFSICAVDPESGLCGAAVASKYPAVGKVVAHARAGVGAFCTQHYGVQKWGEPALDALAAGTRPEQVIADLLKGDNQPEQRQLGIVDMKGQTAVHNPTQAPKGSNYWAAMTGRNYCVQGNTLVGREVITEMARAYEETKGSFSDRLMASLLAGDAVGGDHRGRLAAGIRIAKTGTEGYWFELHVDESGDAVVELMENYGEQKHDARGDWDVAAALNEAAEKRKNEK
jgi:uncharacterized Ntn-hydrolase superfamily protein